MPKIVILGLPKRSSSLYSLLSWLIKLGDIVMFFIAAAHAQEQAPADLGTAFEGMLPLVLIMVVFYFLLIRPQQKKIKEHGKMVDALKKGDDVLTGGGIFGKIYKVENDNGIVHVEIANDVRVKVNKSTIVEVLSSDKAKAVNDNKSGKKDSKSKNKSK